jgi:starch phosphorylase
MDETGQPFDVALAVTRAGNLFTTHTAVAAGFDRFDPALIEQYLGGYAETKLGISLQDVLALGRQNPADSSEPFNMACLAIRGSGAVNGVSRLHGTVSRRLFLPLFPGWPEDEIPVGHVTNGVHVPTWDSAPADDLWTESCGKARWLGTDGSLEKDIHKVSDTRLWHFRTAASTTLVDYARARLALDLTAVGAPPAEVNAAKQLLDPRALTLGFARRFATYKRPNLLLHDPQRPVQLIISGKAHPEDLPGQALIQEWVQFIRRPETRPHVIFLSDYDMLLGERLVQGVDVWINTPRRPWEACGTSGMKVLVNGGINLSVLDGWWAEAYAPEVGWALGDGREHGDDPALYDLLEREVVPEFYARDEQGIPTAWVARMRESMARLTPLFAASRAVRDYTEQHYIRAAETHHARAAEKGALGRQLVEWQQALAKEWPAVHFGEMQVKSHVEQHTFEVQVYLHDLDPEAVRVELYADGVMGGAPERQDMQCVRQLTGVSGGYVYGAAVSAARPAGDYTARVLPHCDDLAIPLEAAHILWQR